MNPYIFPLLPARIASKARLDNTNAKIICDIADEYKELIYPTEEVISKTYTYGTEKKVRKWKGIPDGKMQLGRIRQVKAFYIAKYCRWSHSAIARYLNMERSSVTTTINSFNENQISRTIINQLRKALKL